MAETIRSRVEEAARKESTKFNRLILIIEILVLAAFPILEGIVIQNMPQLNAQGFFWPIIIPLGVVHLLLGLIVVATTKTVVQHYFEYKDLRVEKDNLAGQIENLQRQVSASAAQLEEREGEHKAKIKDINYTRESINLALSSLTKFVLDSKLKPKLSREDVKEGLKTVLKPIIEFRKQSLNFKYDSNFNFGIYLFSDEKNNLKSFYREADARLNKQDRSWSPGAGFIGFCYSNKDTYIIPDAIASDTFSQAMTESDKKNYRSIAVAPIFYAPEKDKNTDIVRGVFIVTSSVPNQFDKELHGYFLRTLSSMLTLFFILTDLKLTGGEKYV